MISAAAAVIEMLVVLDNFDINLHHFHIARLTEKFRIMGVFDNLAFDIDIFTIFRDEKTPIHIAFSLLKALRTEKILKATCQLSINFVDEV